MKKTILFVFHDASLTGASVVLLRFVKLLQKSGRYSLCFIVGQEGPLLEQLKVIGPVCTATPPVRTVSLAGRVWRRLAKRRAYIDERWTHVKRFTAMHHPEIVYCNTVLSIPFIKNLFSEKKHKIVFHIHELELAYAILKQDLGEVLEKITCFIANSEATAKFLQNQFNVPRNKIKVHYPMLPEKIEVDARGDVIKNTGNGFIIGSSGTGMERKGLFAFIQLVALIKRRTGSGKVRFIWVGNIKKNEEEVRYDLNRLKLEDEVLFTGEVTDPLSYYQAFSVFVSLSKEESFGMACAEAGALGIPLFGFSGTGGGEELITSSGGVVVPYLNLNAMADAIIEVMDDPKKLDMMKAAAKAAMQKYYPENVFPAWLNSISVIIEQPTD